MDEMPRQVIEARLHFDEELDALLSAGDYASVLRIVGQMREDLRIFARHAKRLAAAADDPVQPTSRRRVAAEDRHPDPQTARAIQQAKDELFARKKAAGCENVVFLRDRRARGHVKSTS